MISIAGKMLTVFQRFNIATKAWVQFNVTDPSVFILQLEIRIHGYKQRKEEPCILLVTLHRQQTNDYSH